MLAALGARPHERPEFDPGCAPSCAPSWRSGSPRWPSALPDEEVLWVSKHLLGSVHGCEGLFLAQEAEEFAWSTADRAAAPSRTRRSSCR